MGAETQSNDNNIQHTILIVDEEANVLTLLGLILKRGGFKVVTAQSGIAALDMIDNQMPKMVITDITMPGMDGIELCRTLRSREDTKDILIVIHSARSDTESIQRSMDAGADDYFQKPILQADLIARVNALLE